MKNLVNYLLLFSLFATTLVNAQVKIGDNPEAIDQSSILELESNSKAFVITRLSESAMNAITPLHGALVYNTDAGCVFYYNGSQWSNLCEDDNTTNVSLTLEDALLTLTDSDGNEVSVPLAGAVEQTFTADPIVNFRETIIITQDGNNYNFEVGEITGDNIVDSSINGIDIQDNSITQDQLAPNSVGQNELEENAVADNEIDYSQVTLNDFTNDAGYITTAEIISADAGNDITDQNGAYYDDSLLQDAITTNATAVNNHINNDQDTAIDNEVITQFEIIGDELILNEAGIPYSVNLAGFNNSGSDDQTLAEVLTEGNSAGNQLIRDVDDPQIAQDAATKNYVDNAIASIPAGSDNQNLSLAGSNLNISGGTGVDLGPLLSSGADGLISNVALVGNNLQFTGTGAGFNGNVNLAPLANTDNQNLTLAGNTINISGGTGVDLTPILGGGADGAITGVTLNGTDLEFTGSGTGFTGNIPLASLQDGFEPNTDNQNLANVLGQGNDAGGVQIENLLDPNDNQDAATKKYVDDTVVAAGGGVPTDELITGFALNTTTLTITEDGVNWPVDLDPTFVTETELTTALAGIPPNTNTTNTSLTQDGTNLILTDSDTNTVTIPLADISSGADTNTTNASLTEDGTNLILTDSDTNTVTIPLATLTAAIDTDTNTTNASLTQDGTNLILTDSDTNTVTIPLADISSGGGTVVNGSTSIDVSGSGSGADPYVVSIPDAAIQGSFNGGGANSMIIPNTIGTADIGANAVTASEIDSDAVGRTEINADVAGDGLNQNVSGALEIIPGNAANQILKWDGTNWALGSDNTGGTTPTDADTNDGLSTFDASTGYNVNVDNATIEINGDQLRVKEGGITSGEILNGSIGGEDLNDMSADDGDLLQWNAGSTAWVPATITITPDGNDFVTTGSFDQDTQYLTLNVTNQTPFNIGLQNLVTENELTIASNSLTLSSNTNPGNVTLSNGSTVDINVNDGDFNPTNEIQSISAANASIVVNSVGGNDYTIEVGTVPGANVIPDFGTQEIRGGDIYTNGTLIVPDYVFENYYEGFSTLNDSYNFKELSEIEAFIKKHKHLPGITSAYQAQKDGQWNLSQSNLQNLEKIEELFLHTIEQEKKIKALQQENTTLSEELDALKKDMALIKELLAAKKE